MCLLFKKITITITNNELFEDNCDKQFLDIINKTYFYYATPFTSIKRLFLYLLKQMKITKYDEYSIQEQFSFIIDNEFIYANTNYNLNKFLKEHGVSSSKINIHYDICTGGGNGATFDELCTIKINPSEPSHRYTPHVHIYKKDYKKCVRVNLNTLEKMKNDKYDLSSFFTKKEINHIKKILTEKNAELIDFYNRIQKGEKPQEFIIEYNNKKVIFK